MGAAAPNAISTAFHVADESMGEFAGFEPIRRAARRECRMKAAHHFATMGKRHQLEAAQRAEFIARTVAHGGFLDIMPGRLPV